jgi:uncharacterized protein YxjI
MYLIREQPFRLGEHAEVTDESGQAVLQVDGKVFSLHNQLTVRDRFGTEVAEIRRKAVALSPTYRITMRGEQVAEVHKRLGHPFGDQFTVQIAGSDDLDVVGDLLDHEFTVQRGDEVAATVSRRWLSLQDTYAVSVAAGQDDFLILAIVLALDLAEQQEPAQL